MSISVWRLLACSRFYVIIFFFFLLAQQAKNGGVLRIYMLSKGSLDCIAWAGRLFNRVIYGLVSVH